MDAIEKRARELLAAQYTGPYGAKLHELIVQQDLVMNSHQLAALKALMTALTPPEGYVLVPVAPTREMVVAGVALAYDGKCESVYAAMIAARPEAP